MLAAEFILLVICIIGSAFFSGMETGIISIHHLRLRHLLRRGAPGAETLQTFRDNPDHLLGTTLVGTNICNVVGSVMATSVAVAILGSSGYGVATAAMTFVLLIAGEYLPKAWFQSSPTLRTRPFANTLKIFGYVLYPLSYGVTAIAKILVPARGREEQRDAAFVTREEIRHLTQEGERAGEFTSKERRMIHSVFDLTTKTCGDIMVPRDQWCVVTSDTPAADVLRLAAEKKCSRFPVYQKEDERFVGMVNIEDILVQTAPPGHVGDYMRPPQFVRIDTPLHRLLARMRSTRQSLALVTDQKSDVLGLVTAEDVLQEIFGKV